MDGENSDWGSLKCGCHPNCGIGTMLLVNERSKQAVPIPQILNTDQLMEDLKIINDSARGRLLTTTQMVLSMLRNYRHDTAPKELGFWQVTKIIDGHNGQRLGLAEKGRYDWRIMLVAGMWFQDLFNYDFRRTEMCIIPYGTQVGEVSFCAYNTGVGWRNIVENMFQVASTKEWYATKGRHKVYAAGKEVPLPEVAASEKGRKKVRLPVVGQPERATAPAFAMDGVKITGMNAGGCGSH
jgi:uncharacterized radical SAM superfamily Fe-S cluster-containing enzyme